MKWKHSWLFFFVFLLPVCAHAGVLINEIAWMGSADSSTDEWIELYNPDTSIIDLSGWRIVADDGSPTILLSGTIAPGGYFLVERTDDNSVANVIADFVAPFGNGLGNAGETLRLKDEGDTEVDVVAGGTDWVNVGGDNTTKETAQRTANSWVTGTPTPRAQNVAQDGEVEGASTTNTTTNTASTVGTIGISGGTQKPSMYPRTNIVVEAGGDVRGFVGFPVALRGSSTGLFNEPLDRATYRWNFGDGSTGEGQVQSHAYDFAGEYLVTLEVFWGGYHAQDRLSVVVVSPDVAVAEFISGQSGYVRLKNNTAREIDLSGWTLRHVSDTPAFQFPPNSIILPKKTVTVSNKTSGIVEVVAQLSLYFPNGSLASLWSKTDTPEGLVAGAKDIRAMNMPATHSPQVAPLPRGITKTSPLATPAVTSEPHATSSVAATVLWEKQSANTANTLLDDTWVFALLAVMLVILVGFMLMRSQRGEPTIDEEYAIIEDIIEGKEELLGK